MHNKKATPFIFIQKNGIVFIPDLEYNKTNLTVEVIACCHI